MYRLRQNKTSLQELEHELIAPRVVSYKVGGIIPGLEQKKGPRKGAKTMKKKLILNDDNDNNNLEINNF